MPDYPDSIVDDFLAANDADVEAAAEAERKRRRKKK